MAGENHLSFIETSALDASNVELAFQNILTGMLPVSLHPVAVLPLLGLTISPAEIYRIVSSKALDGGDGTQANIESGITLSDSVDKNAAKGGKCC